MARGQRLDEGRPKALLSQHLVAELLLQLGVGGLLSGDRPPGCSPRLLPALQAPSRCCLRWVFPRAPALDMPASVLATVNGQVLPAFLLCSTLLVIKMYVVAVITGQVRLRKKVRAALGAPRSARASLARGPGGFRARG